MPMPFPRTPTSIAVISLAALWGVSLAPSRAAAGTVIGHCVSTAQQLQNALSSASDGGQYNGMDNRIKIVEGLYQTRLVTNPGPGTFFYANSADTGVLSVEGGYNADCSARSSNPIATLIDGNSLYPVMDLRSRRAQIKVSGITLENGESISEGAGLSINAASNDDSAVLVFDTIIRNNHTTRFGGGLDIGSDGTGNMAVVHNTLIIGNSADLGYSAAQVVSNGDGILFYDNTVSGNSVPASGTARSVYLAATTGTCDVANNIIQFNPNGGLWMVCTGAATLYFNDIGTILNDGGAVRAGNVSVDPKFVDASGGDYRLASSSPLIGMSHWLTRGADLLGAAYPGAGHQDVGAYEDTVFVDSFDEQVLF